MKNVVLLLAEHNGKQYSNADKLACATRELRLRMRVYEWKVSQGSMTRDFAQKEISLMAAIVADYRALVEKDSPSLL